MLKQNFNHISSKRYWYFQKSVSSFIYRAYIESNDPPMGSKSIGVIYVIAIS